MKSTVVPILSSHHPPLFQRLLDECENRVARMHQIEKWLADNHKHFEWFESTWSLSEHEEGSEEYAFVKIYQALEDIKKFYDKQPEIVDMFKNCPPDDSTYEFRKWARGHEDFYRIYIQAYNTKYQDYKDLEIPGPRHLTVPIHCYPGIEIYVHHEDFSKAYRLVQIMEKYLASEAYVPPLKFYESIDIDPALWEDETFLREFAKNRKESSYFDDEEDDEDYEEFLELSQDYSVSDSIKDILLFHETMVEFDQIKEWVKKAENIFWSLIEDHDKFCGCCYCDPFYDIYHPMYQLTNLIHKKNDFARFESEYESLKNDPVALASFFIKNSIFLWYTYTPHGLTKVRPGLYCYEHPRDYYHTLRFIYQTEDMEDIFDRIEGFQDILEGLENFILDVYNRENKTYFRHYYEHKMQEYFKERLYEVAAGYFIDNPAV